jgi:hypothetical protein
MSDYRKNKSFIEFYGAIRAKIIKGKIAKTVSKQLKGVSYGERYGSKAKLIIKKISNAHKGKIVSDISRKKMSQYRMGKTYEQLYGIELANEIKRKRSDMMIGKTFEDRFGKAKADRIKRKRSDMMIGKTFEDRFGKAKADRIKQKLRNANLGVSYDTKYGVKRSKEIKIKLSDINRGKTLEQMYGYRRAKKIRMLAKRSWVEKYGEDKAIKIKLQIRNSNLGDKCWCWKGVNCRGDYDLRFDWFLKDKIIKKYKSICQGCFINIIKPNHHHCHHINHNKHDSRIENLILLCSKCHHFIHRKLENKDYWFSYFCYLKGIESEVLLCSKK